MCVIKSCEIWFRNTWSYIEVVGWTICKLSINRLDIKCNQCEPNDMDQSWMWTKELESNTNRFADAIKWLDWSNSIRWTMWRYSYWVQRHLQWIFEFDPIWKRSSRSSFGIKHSGSFNLSFFNQTHEWNQLKVHKFLKSLSSHFPQ